MYHTPDGTKHYDFNYNQEGTTYRKSLPTVWNFQRKKKVDASTDTSSRTGKVCRGCGLTRSRSNKCDCNS